MDDMRQQPVSSGSSNTQTPSLGSSLGSAAAKGSSKGLSIGTKKPSKKIAIWIAIVLLVLALGGGGYLFYDKYQNIQEENKNIQEENKRLSNPQEAAKLEQQQLISSVGKLTELPAGETPTVATVSDASKLKTQSFFADSENGDKVLIYTQAKKAYLYRPSTDKIINIAPVNIGNNESSGTGQ